MRSTGLKIVLTAAFVVAVALSASPYVFGRLSSQDTLNTSGVVADVTVGIYTDAACTVNLTAINWGVCYPGDTKTVTAYVKNLGTMDMVLTINTTNWDPVTASTHLILTSNYGGQPLQPDEVVRTTLTLDVTDHAGRVERVLTRQETVDVRRGEGQRRDHECHGQQGLGIELPETGHG